MRLLTVLLVILLIFCAFLYFPAESTDLSSMLPVETICVERKYGQIIITADKVRGTGGNWETAMENLQATATGTVFLATAERVVVAESAADSLPDILQDERLRPAAQLYLLRGTVGATLPEFAAAHTSDATIADCREVPVILEEAGRYRLA
ncbi:MAG: hypothetical protein VB055_11450 [Oscillospiraceae bacterium]|nr:hypothetical protein [Oscillospiraceae bacterium]